MLICQGREYVPFLTIVRVKEVNDIKSVFLPGVIAQVHVGKTWYLLSVNVRGWNLAELNHLSLLFLGGFNFNTILEVVDVERI